MYNKNHDGSKYDVGDYSRSALQILEITSCRTVSHDIVTVAMRHQSIVVGTVKNKHYFV